MATVLEGCCEQEAPGGAVGAIAALLVTTRENVLHDIGDLPSVLGSWSH